MLTKKKYSGELAHLVSSIQKSSNLMKRILIFKKVGNYSLFLNKLVERGLIFSFNESKSVLLIRLNVGGQLKINTSLSSIKYINSESKSSIFSCTKLKRLLIRDGGSVLTLLNTDQGFLFSDQSALQRIGGKSLLRLL